MSIAGILLGIINIAIVIAILVLVGLVIVWFASWMGFAVPEPIKRVFMVIVFLIGLGMLVALLLGVRVGPTFIGGATFPGLASSPVGPVPSGASVYLQRMLT